MKKKTTKKLTLNRETLSSLESELEKVAAGAYTDNPDICWSGQRTCATCGRTCTTNLC